MPLFDPDLFDPDLFDEEESGPVAADLPFTGMPGKAWVGKVALGHHGTDIVYAPDATVELEGAASGTSTAVASLRVVEDVLLEGTANGTAAPQGIEPTAHLTVVDTLHNGQPITPTTAVFRLDGVEITDEVELELCEFIASARGTPGTATLRIRNPVGEYRTGMELTCDLGGVRMWGGFVMAVRHGFYFPAAVEEHRFVILNAVDYNILTERRILYDKADPANVELTKFPPGTSDRDIIRYYVANHTDLLADGINVVSGVEHVGTPSTDDEISGAASWRLNEFLRHIRFNTGAIDYIDPDRRLVHTDVDTPNAPFGISDQPGPGEVGARDLEIDYGGEKLRNDVMVWGVGQGAVNAVFSRVEDDPSIAAHDRWQVGRYLPVVWRQETVDRIADSYVYGSPQNRRGGKDDAVAVRCVLHTPGLRVADKVNVRSVVYGFEDVLPVRELKLTWPTASTPRFDLVLSHEIDDPWQTVEFWFPDFPFNPPDLGDIEMPPIPVPPEIWVPPLPPPPQWTDSEGNPIIGVHPPPACNAGEFVFIKDDPEDVFGWRVGMFAMGGTIPNDLPLPDHPSGYGYYLIDGTAGTGLHGYRWQTADAIIWSGPIPMYVAWADIVQGIGGTVKNLSARLRMYVSPNQNGSAGWYVGDTGPVSGPSTEGTNSMRVASGTNQPVRYVRVESAAPAWRQPGVFNVAGNWIVNSASLVATCAVGVGPDMQNEMGGGATPGIPGWDPVVRELPEPPASEPPDDEGVYFSVVKSWIPGTLMVWVAGLLQNPATYTENSVERWIRLAPGTTGFVYIRFMPII